MVCDSSNVHKQKLLKQKPLASRMAAVKKVGQKIMAKLDFWLSTYSVIADRAGDHKFWQ